MVVIFTGYSIGVLSGKGGVGKSSTAAGIASCLAALGKTVLCVDADVGLRSLDLCLGLTDRNSLDFSDVIFGRATLDKAAIKHDAIEGLFLLAAPMNIRPEDIPKDKFCELIRLVSDKYDYVIVDGGAGIEYNFEMVAQSCSKIIIVTMTEVTAVRSAAIASQKLPPKKQGWLVVNRVKPKLIKLGHNTDVDYIIDTVALPLIGLVPEDEVVSAAAHQGIPVILAVKTGAAVAYLRIARRLTGEYVPLKRLRQWKING